MTAALSGLILCLLARAPAGEDAPAAGAATRTGSPDDNAPGSNPGSPAPAAATHPS